MISCAYISVRPRYHSISSSGTYSRRRGVVVLFLVIIRYRLALDSIRPILVIRSRGGIVLMSQGFSFVLLFLLRSYFVPDRRQSIMITCKVTGRLLLPRTMGGGELTRLAACVGGIDR